MKLSIFLSTVLKLYTKYEFIKWTEDLHPQKIPLFAGIRFADHGGRDYVFNHPNYKMVSLITHRKS